MKRIEYVQKNVGEKDPQYGGVLTDVASLPVGTTFYVNNGAWYGKIVERANVKSIKPSSHPFEDGVDDSEMPHVPIWPEGHDDNVLALSDVKLPRAETTGDEPSFETGDYVFVVHPETEEIVSGVFEEPLAAPGGKTVFKILIDASDVIDDYDTREVVVPPENVFSNVDVAINAVARRLGAQCQAWFEEMKTADGLINFAMSHDLTPPENEDTALNRKRAAMRDCFSTAAKLLLKQRAAEET